MNTQIERATTSGFMAELLVDGNEVRREWIACEFKEGYLISGPVLDTKVEGLLNLTGSHSFGLGLNTQNEAVVDSQSEGTLYLVCFPIFSADSGGKGTAQVYARAEP